MSQVQPSITPLVLATTTQHHECFCPAIRDSQQPISPIGFLFLKLAPSPRAVLLVFIYIAICHTLRLQEAPKLNWKDGIIDEIARILQSLGTMIQGDIELVSTIPRSRKIKSNPRKYFTYWTILVSGVLWLVKDDGMSCPRYQSISGHEFVN